jgi:hypothetical protein
VDPEAHGKLLEQMRGESGVLIDKTRGQMQRVRNIRHDLAIIGARPPSDSGAFLSYLLFREQDDAVNRVLDLLEIIGDTERVQALRTRLLGGDGETRRRAMRKLADACPGASELVRELEPWIVDRMPVGPRYDEDAWAQLVERHALSADPYFRASAVWIASGADEGWAQSIVAGAEKDADQLVRWTALRRDDSDLPATRFSSLAPLERMQFLRRVPLFADLDPDDLRDLVLLTEEEIVSPPDVLCEEGDVDADDLYILIEGTASVLIRTQAASGESADQREVAVLRSGEVVGEMSLLDGSPRSATVRPKDGPIRVLRIPGHLFRSRLIPRSRVARSLLLTLAQRIRDISRRAVR